MVDGAIDGNEAYRSSLTQGVRDFFTMPFNKCKQDGIKGLVKGLGEGCSSLFFKPQGEVMNMVTKTCQGYLNHV